MDGMAAQKRGPPNEALIDSCANESRRLGEWFMVQGSWFGPPEAGKGSGLRVNGRHGRAEARPSE